MRCWKASTPPRMTAISPGKTTPKKADASSAGKRKITSNATQPCNDRIVSVTRLNGSSPDGRPVERPHLMVPGSTVPNGETRPRNAVVFGNTALGEANGRASGGSGKPGGGGTIASRRPGSRFGIRTGDHRDGGG